MRPEGIRINRFLARAGVASRRKAEEFILAGEVRVNGTTVKDLFYRVKEEDEVFCKEKRIFFPTSFSYLALNKPPGYIVSRRVPPGEKSIFELISKDLQKKHGLLYAGRLDKMSRGLLLLSDDGDFIQKMTHPSHKLPRHYSLRLRAFIRVELAAIQHAFLEGIEDDGEILRAVRLRLRPQGANTFLMDVSLESGRKRQLRRMCDQVGFEVLDLNRTGIGGLSLENLELEEGHFRQLTPQELSLLESASLQKAE